MAGETGRFVSFGRPDSDMGGRDMKERILGIKREDIWIYYVDTSKVTVKINIYLKDISDVHDFLGYFRKKEKQIWSFKLDYEGFIGERKRIELSIDMSRWLFYRMGLSNC